jgi:hypothetical protein
MIKRNKQTFNQRIHVQEKSEMKMENNITERGVSGVVGGFRMVRRAVQPSPFQVIARTENVWT